MGFWDRAINGGDPTPPPEYRPVSTPSRGDQVWYPNPQFQPRDTEPWARPPVAPEQAANMELSEDLMELMGGESGTTVMNVPGAKFAMPGLDDGMAFLDNVDPNSLSQAMRNEWEWRRIYRAPLHGKSKAMRAEPDRCPQCGDPRFFNRSANKKNGMSPAPMCMACSYTGSEYNISQLNA